MGLEPDPNSPGLWIDRLANAEGPGTFAVIIGASRYEHLAGGNDRLAQQQFPGLGQLEISALTAYRFFEWLRTRYVYQHSPLVRCWLLLAPTEKEKELIEPTVVAHSRKPDFASCNVALNDWFTTMKGLSSVSGDIAAASRSFFFFSGHGVEFYPKKQCLLPCDFPMPLDPPLAQQERFDRIIGTGNIAEAMNGLGVSHHFFFLDACRVDLEGLKEQVPMDGYSFLPVPNVKGSRSNSIFRFHATTTGNQAYQGGPPDLTVYGQAVLDGLSAPPKLAPDCNDHFCSIPAHKLICYLNMRIPELLANYADYHQEPYCSVDATNPAAVITHVNRPPDHASTPIFDPCQESSSIEGVAFVVESLGPSSQRGLAGAVDRLRPVYALQGPYFDSNWKVWDVKSGDVITALQRDTGAIRTIALSPDGRRPALAGRAETLNIWDIDTDHIVQTLSGLTGDATALAFSPDGRRVASASGDQTVKLWDVNTGQKIRTFSPNAGDVLGVAFSLDGTQLASANEDNTVRVWESLSGQEPRILRGHYGGVTSVAFSPDGRHLASASRDESVGVWDLRTGEVLRRLTSHKAGVTSVAFSPDGKLLASASRDQTLKIWDMRSGKSVRNIPSQIGEINAVAFSPNGQLLAAADGVRVLGNNWPSVAMRISAKDLAKQRMRVTAGYERARSRKDETAANRIELRLRDLTRAQNELGENLSQWSFDPGKPVISTGATEQLLSQIEAMVIDARKRSIQPLDRSQLVLHRFDRLPGAMTYRIEIGLAGECTGFWLSLRGSPTPFSCYLMPGAGDSTRYLIEIDSGGPDEAGALQLSRVRVNLSQANAGIEGGAAGLWHQSKGEGPSERTATNARMLLERSLEQQSNSPLATVVALLLLLRNGATKGLDEIVEHLYARFPQWADVAAIRIEQIYRQQAEWNSPPPGVVETLLSTSTRGLPIAGDGLGYLTERIDSTLRFRTLLDDQREQLEQLQRAVRQVLTAYRSGGLFCVFTRSIDQVDPLLSQLPWNR